MHRRQNICGYLLAKNPRITLNAPEIYGPRIYIDFVQDFLKDDEG